MHNKVGFSIWGGHTNYNTRVYGDYTNKNTNLCPSSIPGLVGIKYDEKKVTHNSFDLLDALDNVSAHGTKSWVIVHKAWSSQGPWRLWV